MARQPESKIVRQIQDLVQRQGGRAFKIHGGDPFQESGIPDLICCYHSFFVAFEVKQPGETPSAIQALVINQIKAAKGVACVVTSVDEAKRILQLIDRQRRHDDD